MISHGALLAKNGLDLILEQERQQIPTYGIDSIEPKCQELEEMKKKLTNQIDEKRQNLKYLRTYIDKLESVKITIKQLFSCSKKFLSFLPVRSIVGVHGGKIC